MRKVLWEHPAPCRDGWIQSKFSHHIILLRMLRIVTVSLQLIYSLIEGFFFFFWFIVFFSFFFFFDSFFFIFLFFFFLIYSFFLFCFFDWCAVVFSFFLQWVRFYFLLLSPTGGTYVMSHTFCSSQPTMLCKAEEGSLHFCVNILCVDSTKQCLVCYYLCWYSNFTLRSDPGKNNE